ncbi:MAG: hypothetical protein E7423_01295 [Ruminococcaceae bacterium]|nr:hypothetical protein [Oscillospiraceae bacterium]
MARMKRVISLILALSLMCGQMPLSRAAQTYWSISYDPTSFPDGLTAALYRADTDNPAEIDWQASAGSLSSGMTPQTLFAQGDWYAVVQYAPTGRPRRASRTRAAQMPKAMLVSSGTMIPLVPAAEAALN